MAVHQNVEVYDASLESGGEVTYDLAPGRSAWLQVLKGALILGATALETGDGAAISGEERLSIRAVEDAEFIFFDLA